MDTNNKWLPWILGGGALLVVYLLMSGTLSGGESSSGSSVITSSTPDTSASDAARYGFLSSGIGTLAALEQAISHDQFSLAALHDSNAAAVQAAQAQASAETAAAKASTAGKHGLALGPISFTW